MLLPMNQRRRTWVVWIVCTWVIWLVLQLANSRVVGQAGPADPVEPVGAAAGEVTRDLWYQLAVDGQPAGWMSTRELHSPGQVISEMTLELSFRRGDLTQRIRQESRFVETPEGHPLELWTRQELDGTPLELRYRFTADGVKLESNPPVDLPLPSGVWLTPAQAQARLEQELRAQREAFTLRTIDPTIGLEPVTVKWQLLRRDVDLTAAGQFHRTTEWRQELSLAPQLATVANLDAAGTLIRSSTQLLGLNLVLTLADRRAPLATSAAPEILRRTFIAPKRKIPRPRETQRVVYALRVPDGGGIQLPSTGDQEVVTAGERTLVTVELGTWTRKPASAEAVHLAASNYLDYHDPAVQALLAQALPSGSVATAEKAEALRRFVNTHLIRKDLGSVFATASEVARSRAGDCTEHSVLLTALLRAAGIPARVAIGLIYVEVFAGSREIFGYHMWSQAMVDGHWLDLDATLESRRFDAAHITLGIATLSDNTALQEMMVLLPLVGSLELEVLAVEHLQGNSASRLRQIVFGVEQQVGCPAGIADLAGGGVLGHAAGDRGRISAAHPLQAQRRHTSDVRRCHRRPAERGRAAFAAGRSDVDAGREQVDAFSPLIGKTGTPIAVVRSPSGERLEHSGRRATASIGAVIARGDRVDHPGSERSAHGEVESGSWRSPKAHVGDGGPAMGPHMVRDPINALNHVGISPAAVPQHPHRVDDHLLGDPELGASGRACDVGAMAVVIFKAKTVRVRRVAFADPPGEVSMSDVDAGVDDVDVNSLARGAGGVLAIERQGALIAAVEPPSSLHGGLDQRLDALDPVLLHKSHARIRC